jgi:hypothetical protein
MRTYQLLEAYGGTASILVTGAHSRSSGAQIRGTIANVEDGRNWYWATFSLLRTCLNHKGCQTLEFNADFLDSLQTHQNKRTNFDIEIQIIYISLHELTSNITLLFFHFEGWHRGVS